MGRIRSAVPPRFLLITDIIYVSAATDTSFGVTCRYVLHYSSVRTGSSGGKFDILVELGKLSAGDFRSLAETKILLNTFIAFTNIFYMKENI